MRKENRKILSPLPSFLTLFFIKLFLFVLFIGTMTCFLDILLIVMLIQGLGLLLLLIMHWILSMFFVLRMGKTFLILRTLLVLLPTLEACMYDIFQLPFIWDNIFVLKNLEISLTSLAVLADIEGRNLSILAGLLLFLSLGLLFLTGLVFSVQWKDIFCLKELLLVSATNESYLTL